MMPIVLFGVAFVVRAAVGAMFPGPAYPDAYYYVNVARDLAAGHGLTVNYIWNFVEVGGRLPVQPTLPIAADAHWMPLAEFVQVPFIWILGPTPLASMLPFWIIGALAAPMTYWIAREAQLPRWAGISAGIMVAVPAALTPYFAQPDNFGLFITLGAASLWMCARGLRGDRRAFVFGGALVALATLARSDGVLLGVPFALVGVHGLLRRTHARVGLAASAGCAVAFVAVISPWLIRQFAVFGSAMPSAGSGILWLVDYHQLFSVANPPTFDAWIQQGIGPLVASRVGGLIAALGLFALLPLMAVLVPFALAGSWVHRRDPAFAPFFVYALALFLASGLLFAIHVPYGTFIHSASALLPHAFLLVVTGVGATVRAVARARTSWNVPQATRVFVAGAVGVAVLGGIVGTATTLGKWQSVRTAQQTVTAALDGTDDAERVMSADPGAIRYLTGHGGIVTPDDDLSVIEQALRDYDVRWLVLERAQIVPAMVPVLMGNDLPAWLSRPVAVAQAADGDGSTGAPAAALYAVCFGDTDARCSR
jgi:4-amino-4-deoxy-L-arabinose transferase-like glycosyltransferase